jgi:predicted aconitase with swiveling domain
LIAGEAEGAVLKLSAPISLWGGVDPVTGCIGDPRHPDYGSVITGRILAIPATVGSSSSSAIMLELLRRRTAPAAILLTNVDAILTLGVIVAREMGYETVPVLQLARDELAKLPNAGYVRVGKDGDVEVRSEK